MPDNTFRWQWGESVFAQAIKMELDCRKQFGFGFLNGGASRDAARQIGRVGGVVVFGFFDNDGIAHGFNLAVMLV